MNVCFRDLLAPGGVLLKKGDTLRRPKLAETLQNISKFGFDYFYNSTMTDDMVNEINELGGNFTKEDFLGYTVLERNVTRSEYKGFPLLSTPPPGSGAILSMILSVLEGELRCLPFVTKLCFLTLYPPFYHFSSSSHSSSPTPFPPFSLSPNPLPLPPPSTLTPSFSP